jgi:hypothetical protein
MSDTNNFKVGDKVKRVKYIDGIWSEMCHNHKLDKHGVHSITSVVQGKNDVGIAIENMADQWNPEGFTFTASCFELVETKVEDNFIAVITKEQVVINDIAYPAKLIKDIAAALNSIQ